VRAQVLARDGFRCQIRLEGICTVTATEVDHVDPLALYGPTCDLSRLRAACGPCNHHLGGHVAQLKTRIAQASARVGPSREW
jgi:5-methylcytosine-specific restriction endonuclease McrA